MPVEHKLTLFLGDEVDIDLGPPLDATGQPAQLDGDVQLLITGNPQDCCTLIVTPDSHNQKFTLKASKTVPGHADLYIFGDTNLGPELNSVQFIIYRIDVVANPAVQFRPKVTGPNRPELLPKPRPYEIEEHV